MDNNAEKQLIEFIATCYSDPLRFVQGMFDWQAIASEPDKWQIEVLTDIKKHLQQQSDISTAFRLAVASGHGVGKSALVAWVILWAMSTRINLRGVITANTQTQLKEKTWAELSLWHKRLLNQHWFELTATKIAQVQHPETWFVSAVPWSKERSEAFAGLHAEHVLVMFDEASAIEDIIYDTAEGAMTTTGAMFFAFGNPTRNRGRFYEIHHKYRNRWICKQVDSRSAKMTNKAELQAWAEDYGEDSDFYRIRVKGEFPRQSSNQLISLEDIEHASTRNISLAEVAHSPRVMGVDVARFGGDSSVITKRQGLLTHEQIKHIGLDLMTFANIVAQEIDSYQPDMVFIDAGGVGGGVIDRLHQLGYRNVVGVDFGGTASDKTKYVNKRAEMWCNMRDYLKQGSIPAEKELHSDLSTIEYFFRGDNGQIQLESKSDMRRRGVQSPDLGDSLALTFAQNITNNKNSKALKGVKLR